MNILCQIVLLDIVEREQKKTVFSVGTAALNIKFAVEFILGSAMIIIIYCSYKCFR
jgi:hypothetical protein